MPTTKPTYGVNTSLLTKTAKKRGKKSCIKYCKKKYPRGRPNSNKKELCITACNITFGKIAKGVRFAKTKRRKRNKSRKLRRRKKNKCKRNRRKKCRSRRRKR